MMARAKQSFACTECGCEQPRWVGQCPSCGSWSTIVEKGAAARAMGEGPRPLADVDGLQADRRATGIGELDRVLGGGIVPGSLTLLAGEPGIGKSTLALQLAARAGAVLYAAGEESPAQIKLRADRLGVAGDRILVTTAPAVETILKQVEAAKPSLAIVDSIQTVRVEDPSVTPGAVNQIRESAARCMRCAKSLGIPIVLVGHVTKSGDIAGPMLLEHLVDAVLVLETDTSGSYRLLRSTKNRFGSTDEVGLFAMSEAGMREVTNPSEILLPAHQAPAPGSAITVSMEGRRPLVLELQALTMPTAYGIPRRLSTGIDPNRLALLLAVLERRGRTVVSKDDVYLNSAGGFRLKETAVDLAAVAAVASALRDQPLPAGAVFLGEVGLGGEVRPVGRLEPRLREAAALGFKTAWTPPQKAETPSGLAVRKVETIEELLEALFPAP